MTPTTIANIDSARQQADQLTRAYDRIKTWHNSLAKARRSDDPKPTDTPTIEMSVAYLAKLLDHARYEGSDQILAIIRPLFKWWDTRDEDGDDNDARLAVSHPELHAVLRSILERL